MKGNGPLGVLIRLSSQRFERPTCGVNGIRDITIGVRLNNKEFIAKEVTAYMNSTYPNHVGNYNEEEFEKRIEEILDSVSLDSLLGNNANFLSRYAGLTYYASVEGQILIGTQKTETVAGITYAKNIVKNYILTNIAVPTNYQTQVTQFINGAITPDALADDAIDAKFQIVLDVINNGALNAPQVVDGTTTYKRS